MSGRLAKFGAGVSLFPLLVLFSIELLDQATQSAFNVLTPNIRDAFHLTNAGILLIVAIAGAAALLFTLPVAVLADRMRRVPIALVGALVGAAFSIGLGVANGVVVAAVMLAGISMGQAVIFPTHNSLLADYYPVEARPRIYSTHRSGISLGAIIGVLLGAGLAAIWSWRAPFFVFAVPIVIVVIVGLRLPRTTARPARAGATGRADARVRAWRTRAAGRRPRHDRDTRRAATVARRGLAHGLEDRRPPAHLLRAPLPGRLHRRLHVAGLAPVPGDVPPRRRAPRLPDRPHPGLRPPRPGHRRRHRHPAGQPRHRAGVQNARRGVTGGRRLRRRVRVGAQRPRRLHRQRRHRLLTCHRGPRRPGCPFAGHPGPGALGGLLHRRALRAPRVPGAARHRRHRRRRGLPLRPPHPGAHLRGGRARGGHGGEPDRQGRRERLDLHAHAGPDAGRPARRQAPAARRARPRSRVRRRDRAARHRHLHRSGRDRGAPRHQRCRQVDAPAGRRRCGRGRPRCHRLRRTRHHPPAPRRDRPHGHRPGPGRRRHLPQPAGRGQPARRGLAGPPTRRERRRHDRGGLRGVSHPDRAAGRSAPATSRADSSRCWPWPWPPSPGPSCS